MSWSVNITEKAKKSLRKIPSSDYRKISNAVDKLKLGPFLLPIQKLKASTGIWRLRVGNYRIFIKLFPNEKVLFVFNIKRRTSSTY
ncbi:MAG: type II toxin-antitoxin system RelE/ParE family toxin [Candidatus Yanofskybacteria bacterium]|nr:type II toxin-antitoxin system RelE/ParE family toxin [Candidatus Yanofskybacteria bacterium]